AYSDACVAIVRTRFNTGPYFLVFRRYGLGGVEINCEDKQGVVVMRVGIIGAGGIAQAHINNLKQWDDVQLVGITDVDQARAKSVADQLGAVAYDNVDELF